ncbi:hypothetical protein BcepSauron_426 [Burkholderia phage BcepSauron]|uniref:Uncharacterized protein n=2 Tax=Sarumanvirus TaxID=2843450 RepID=A0A482MMU9_9CAUD|nr:hypothetical protein H1O16_gp424 [Burkholderia phage BcepSaruman]YP_009904804.1 hypothetical protein H1O17_gp426 [Burkholderia phage BcepSauron]QBQ74806.1 hypothetical protein BcepSauron_426 [Burkholderia phage BcepSauron]QBX06837.1 hypothetical protein BcepSaruman_424 [Burkholderia phage BcepSaruman]
MTDQQIKVEAFDMATDIAKTMGYDGVASALRDLHLRQLEGRTKCKEESETGGYDLNRAVFYGYMHGDNVVHGEQAFTMGPLRVHKLPDAGYVQVRVLVGWDL